MSAINKFISTMKRGQDFAYATFTSRKNSETKTGNYENCGTEKSSLLKNSENGAPGSRTFKVSLGSIIPYSPPTSLNVNNPMTQVVIKRSITLLNIVTSTAQRIASAILGSVGSVESVGSVAKSISQALPGLTKNKSSAAQENNHKESAFSKKEVPQKKTLSSSNQAKTGNASAKVNLNYKNPETASKLGKDFSLHLQGEASKVEVGFNKFAPQADMAEDASSNKVQANTLLAELHSPQLEESFGSFSNKSPSIATDIALQREDVKEVLANLSRYTPQQLALILNITVEEAAKQLAAFLKAQQRASEDEQERILNENEKAHEFNITSVKKSKGFNDDGYGSLDEDPNNEDKDDDGDYYC